MAKPNPVGAKIRILMREGKTQRQAVGAAMGMKDSGRLGPRGGYRRVSSR